VRDKCGLPLTLRRTDVGLNPLGWNTSVGSCYVSPMSKVEATAERDIDAPAETVYRYLSNLQEHRQFLPPAFSDFEVEAGGVGAGSVVRFKVTAGARERSYRMTVAEPEPGRVITESDSNSSLVTTFTVTPLGIAARVRISTNWDGAGGIGGFFERLFAPRVMRKIYLDELARLNGYVLERATPGSAG
jgi:uncharacterized protein YndB with AHSA1/START domain